VHIIKGKINPISNHSPAYNTATGNGSHFVSTSMMLQQRKSRFHLYEAGLPQKHKAGLHCDGGQTL